MKKKIFHNWGLKLGSLVLAYLLWLFVKQFGDPAENKTFRGIPVILTNTELLDQEEKVYEVLDNTDTVSVTVRAPGSVIDDLSASDILAVADMSKLTEINTIAITFSLQNGDSVDDIRGNPDVVRLNVEDRTTRWLPVGNQIIGEVAEGYIVAGVQQDQNRIEVTGPESVVSQISKARLEMDVSGATADVTANVEVLLYDGEGNLIDHPGLTKSVNNVRMKVEVLATKEVPVLLHYAGEPADGFLTTGEVRCDPASVMIAGTVSDLSNIDAIEIPAEEMDITGADSNVVKSINIRRILSEAGVRFADSSYNGTVTATVYVEPEVEQTFDVAPESIGIINVPAGLRAVRAGDGTPYRLTVTGQESVVQELEALPAISGTVDLAAWMEEQQMEELNPGIYHVPVSFNIPQGIRAVNTVEIEIEIENLEDV